MGKEAAGKNPSWTVTGWAEALSGSGRAGAERAKRTDQGHLRHGKKQAQNHEAPLDSAETKALHADCVRVFL